MRSGVVADMFPMLLLAAVVATATPLLMVSAHARMQDQAPPAGAESASSEPTGADSAASVVPAAPDPNNAATWYAEAHRKYRAVKLASEQEEALTRFEGDPSRGPTNEVRQLLKRYQPAIMSVRRALRRDDCDFAMSASTATPEYLQRLADARAMSRVLRYDYYLRIFEGDRDGAVNDLAAWYRMAWHFAHEDTLIASVVAAAMIALADGELDHALDHAIIGPAEAAALLREFDRFDAEDPARFREAARNEMIQNVEPLLASFRGEGGVERFRDYWNSLDLERDAQADQALNNLTQDDLETMIERLHDATSRALAALSESDPDKALASAQRVQAEIEDGRLGPFAHNVIGIRARALELMQRPRKTLADRRETLEALALGELDPMSLANAAVWCIRATLMLETIDPAKLAAIDAYAIKHDQHADETLTAILNRHDVQSVIDALRTAANLGSCDFSYANWQAPLTFSRYHAGLLACGRILVADAARLFHEQRYAECAERVAIAFRLSAHVASDGKVAGSLAAHRIFADADALADAVIDSSVLETTDIALLAAAARTISRVDPFHYQPAIASLRQGFEYTITYFVQGLPKNPHEPTTPEQRDRVGAILEGLTTDRLLSFAIIYEYWENAYYYGGRRPSIDATASALAGTASATSAAAVGGLETIYNVQAVRDCADLAPFLTEWSRGGLIENVITSDFPLIAPLEQRSQQSLEDYRRAILRFNRLLPQDEISRD